MLCISITMFCCAQDKEARSREAQQRLQEVTYLLRSVPRDLLLLLRTDDCLRSLEHRLNVPLNTVATTARACTRARHADNARGRHGLLRRLSTVTDRAQVEVRIMVMAAMMHWQMKSKGQRSKVRSHPVALNADAGDRAGGSEDD